MPDARIDSSLCQSTGIHRVVIVIIKRINHRFRHDDRSCKMHDCRDIVIRDKLANQFIITAVTFDKGSPGRNSPAMPLTEIIEDDDLSPGIQKCKRCVATDITCATRYKYSHCRVSLLSLSFFGHACGGTVIPPDTGAG